MHVLNSRRASSATFHSTLVLPAVLVAIAVTVCLLLAAGPLLRLPLFLASFPLVFAAVLMVLAKAL
jgi:hypothetical protein